MAKSGDLTVDVALTNIAVTFFDAVSIWRRIFRNAMNVASIHTWYPQYDEGAFFIKDDRSKYRKGRDSRPKKVDFAYSKKEVVVNGYEAYTEKSRVDLTELSAMGITNAKESMTKFTAGKLNRFVDLDLIDLICNTSAWHTYAVDDTGFSGYAWTDQTNGDPEKDLRQLRLKIIQNSDGAYAPNTVIMNPTAMNHLFMHTKVKARYDSVLADPEGKKKWFFDLFGIPTDRVFEVRTVKNSSDSDTKSNAFAMGAYVWMGYIAENPSRDEPTAMVPLVPQDYVGNEIGVAINQMERLNGAKFEDGYEGIRVFGDQYTEVKLIAKDLGANLTGIYS